MHHPYIYANNSTQFRSHSFLIFSRALYITNDIDVLLEIVLAVYEKEIGVDEAWNCRGDGVLKLKTL